MKEILLMLATLRTIAVPFQIMPHDRKVRLLCQLFLKISHRTVLHLDNAVAAQADKMVPMPQRMQRKAILTRIAQVISFRQPLFGKHLQNTVNRRKVYRFPLQAQLLKNLLCRQHAVTCRQKLQHQLTVTRIL